MMIRSDIYSRVFCNSVMNVDMRSLPALYSGQLHNLDNAVKALHCSISLVVFVWEIATWKSIHPCIHLPI